MHPFKPCYIFRLGEGGGYIDIKHKPADDNLTPKQVSTYMDPQEIILISFEIERIAMQYQGTL